MTKLGGAILAIILLSVAAFASVTRFDADGPTRNRAASQSLPASAPEGALVVPVAGHPRSALRDSWGDVRGEGTRGHRGLDIIAPAGTPVVAVAAGRVEKLFHSERGGTTLYQRSADGRWSYYYAHLAAYAPQIREGMKLSAGQTLGYVGDTGDAGRGNHHLHFAAARMRPGAGWWQGEDVNPYPLLARRGDAR